ncbi:MAG: TrkH family potassium uptake protein [Lachnospiraceae bacterium]|nr:TrkH family potassium uptake protein [Lachnospiraceae bacterium]
MNHRMIRYITGSLIQMEAAMLLVPALTALLYGERYSLLVFLGTALFCVAAGHLVKGKKPEDVTIFSSEGYVSVAVCWIVLSICGAIPLYFSGYFPNPVDALFEIVSGFTTTGATILGDVESLPRSVLMWRSFSHWIGGMGVLVFMMALLPLAGASSMYLMRAESPGPSVGKLVPKVRSTAKILYGIYFFMTVGEFLCLLAAGCPAFDAVNLSFATAGTGGFGVLNSSAGEYNAWIQVILTVFMILFGVNFNVYFLIYSRNIKDALRCEEARIYLGIIGASVVLITVNTLSLFRGPLETLRHAAFQVASIITTTGFSTVDFEQWPELSRTILVILMFVGACAGSTGGGIKVSRDAIMAKTILKELAVMKHPRNVRKTRFEGKPVEHEVLRSINVFLIAYLGIFILSVLLISLDNLDGITNFTAVASTINNIGPGLSKVGPTQNFSIYSNLSKLVLTFDMLAGRLEIFPMLIMCTAGLKGKRWS